MEEIMPLQFIKKHFSIQIIKLHEPIKIDNAAFYYAVTNYGSMTLVIEQYSDTICGVKTTQFLHSRNKLLKSDQKNFPIILQQQLLINHPQQIVCLTLMQKCSILHKQAYMMGEYNTSFRPRLHKIDKIVKAGLVLADNNMCLDNRFGLDWFLISDYHKNLMIDFTKIRSLQLQTEQMQAKLLSDNFTQMRQVLYEMTDYYYHSDPSRIKQVFFIHDRIYQFVPKFILKSTDYFQLQFYFNSYKEQQVQIEYEPFMNSNQQKNSQSSPSKISKRKPTLIQNLRSNPKIVYKNKLYNSLQFLQGRCLNCMSEIFYGDLAQKFISEEIRYYRLYRTNLVSVKAKPIVMTSIKSIDLQQKSNQVNLIIYPTISKFELITFLLAYFKCIQPIIQAINYNYEQNCLSLQLQNKNGQHKTFKMLFYQEYQIRDQEISIIIEKAILRNCKVHIQYLKINDPFMYFLANSQKLMKINLLEISDCAGISQSGINTLLISSFCKNLQTLSIVSQSHFMDTAIQAISMKSTLKNLILINCNQQQQSEQIQPIDLSKMTFQKLSLRGFSVNLQKNLSNTLKYLYLDQLIAIDDIKYLKNLKLQQLRIKLYEPQQKKSLFNSMLSKLDSNPTKNNALRCFLEGNSKNSLKVLDLSGSLIKFKIMKALFYIKTLEQLVLEACPHLGPQVDPLPAYILRLSLANNPQLTMQQISILLDQNQILIELNLSKTRIYKTQLLSYLSNKKKKLHLSNLIVSQNQYSNRMIQKSGFENIEAVQIQLKQMMRPQNEQIFNYMLHKVSKSSKILRLKLDEKNDFQTVIRRKKQLQRHKNQSLFKVSESRQLLIEKIRKYLLMQSKSLNKFKNLYIGQVNFQQIFQQEVQENNKDLGQIMPDFNYIKVHTTRSNFNFSPKIKFPQPNQPINFQADTLDTIDIITLKFLDLLKNYNINNPINISLKNNKIVDKNVIKMLAQYGQQEIKSIDFRGCLFSYIDVMQDIFEFTWINQLNSSQYQIHLNKDNFITNSQLYLKFFMRLKPIKKLRMHIQQVQQVQILYSVLYHIIDQHSLSIQQYKLQLQNLKINQDSEIFLQKIFELAILQNLELSIINCEIKNQKFYEIWEHGINKLSKLKKLKLMLPSFHYPHIKLKKLEEVCLQFTEYFSQDIQQNNLHKCLKNLALSHSLHTLRLNNSICHNIVHLSRIFGSGVGVGNGIGSSLLQKLRNLQNLYLNFQYCPLKQSSLFQFIQGVQKCEKLKLFEINISFTINNLKQLLEVIENLSKKFNKSLNMRIICVTQNSSNFVFNRQQMAQNGIQFVL